MDIDPIGPDIDAVDDRRSNIRPSLGFEVR
jgi:hypothetical protein